MSFKFTVIKKNQILAGAVTLMLVTAGYLNYKYDPNRPYDIEITGIIEENLGDAVLVNANGEIEEFENNKNDDHMIVQNGATPVFQNNSSLSEIRSGEEILNDENTEEKVFKEIEDYFVSTRIDRTNNYAEQIESYENILNGENISEEQKQRAQTEIEKINDIRNSIMISENLIKLKGFEETVILVNDNSINIIVDAENLNSNEVAQIQNIILNEFSVDIKNIHIINYN